MKPAANKRNNGASVKRLGRLQSALKVAENEGRKFLTTKDLAQLSGHAEITLYQMKQKGQLPDKIAFKRNIVLRRKLTGWRTSELAAWLKSQGATP